MFPQAVCKQEGTTKEIGLTNYKKRKKRPLCKPRRDTGVSGTGGTQEMSSTFKDTRSTMGDMEESTSLKWSLKN